LYVWQAGNLLTATAALDSHWQLDAGQLSEEQAGSSNDVTSTRIATDTRTIKSGDIFLALKGDNFDGHDYIATAMKQGAVAAIVSRPISTNIPQLVVS
ncbi:Mur ligase domain-containing protein, partial [Shewanella sp. TB4-MNA-CIBAN-0142]